MTTENAAPAVEETIDIFTDLALNQDTEISGVWVPYRGDVEFLIARSNNRKFRKLFTHQYKKNQRLVDSNTDAGEAKGDELLIDVLAQSVLLGWKGKLAIQGELVQYSVSNAKRLLAIPLFREWVSKQADDIEAYKAVQAEEDQKN